MTNTGKEQPDVVRIAEGLSANMRIALIYAKPTSDGSWWTTHSATVRTSRSLQERGIEAEGRLTELGQAVRDYLTGELKDQPHDQ